MSWSPDVFIGELRPWPDTVHVVRGKTDETRRYVSESERDKLQAENVKLRDEFRKMDEWHSKELVAAIDENAKLRELVRSANKTVKGLCGMVENSPGCFMCPLNQDEDRACGAAELFSRMHELGVDA